MKNSDLVKRADKYARSAGKTGKGHYEEAKKYENWDTGLSIITVILTTGVGASIFSARVEDYPMITGVIAMIAAILTAVYGSMKLGRRSENHRLAGASYGGIRRHADMLKLKTQGSDMKRKEIIEELDKIGRDLTELAKGIYSLSDGVYAHASKDFRMKHPEYYTHRDDRKPRKISKYTHAGGIVYRENDDGIQYLITSSIKDPKDWVLPKGHVERGETLEYTALRETMEETGIEAKVIDLVDDVKFIADKKQVNAIFFLMEYQGDVPKKEKRDMKWCGYEEALEDLAYDESKYLLKKANRLLVA